MKRLKPVHPGEFLLEDYLIPLNMSQNALAKAIGVPPRRINEIILGKRGITADTALRLSIYFKTTPGFWMNFQKGYEMDVARIEHERSYKRMIHPCAAVEHFQRQLASDA